MEQPDHRSDLAHIRQLMDRSTRFISLSGLSGVFAGAVALAGAWMAHRHMSGFLGTRLDTLTYGTSRHGLMDMDELLMLLLTDAMVVLVVAVLGATWFTWRRSQRMGQGLWDRSAFRLFLNLMIPLSAGGIFCLALMYYGLPGLVPPATLVFYGLALVNASKYTLDEIRWLGLSEIALGLLGLFWLGAGLMFWALGFGVLHIVYGGLMWMRHERQEDALQG